MIFGFDKVWAPYLRDIDIKSNEWPWDEDFWKDDVKKYIIKMWMETTVNEQQTTLKKPIGFIAYRFVNIKDLIEKGLEGKGTVIHILKLAVYPKHRNKGIGTKLLENVELISKSQDVKVLITILHEDDKEGREWLLKRGFLGQTLHPEMFPDSCDGYSFAKEIG